jgi:hypothetical protein
MDYAVSVNKTARLLKAWPLFIFGALVGRFEVFHLGYQHRVDGPNLITTLGDAG